MNEQETKLEYPNSPLPPVQGQESQDEGVKFLKYCEEQKSKEADVPVQSESSPLGSPLGISYDKTFEGTLKTGEFKVGMAREKIHDYDTPGATDELFYNESANFLRQKFEESFDRGGPDAFQSTLNHYEQVIESGDLISGDMLSEAKALFAEARQLKTKEEFKEFWKKAEKFYQSWEIGKKED